VAVLHSGPRPPRSTRKFNVKVEPDLFTLRYNIAPTQSVPIVRQAAARELAFVRWELVPMAQP
jgi:putative SOS response-associated peptidase YedK